MNDPAMIGLRYVVERDAFVLDVELGLPMRGITAVFGPSGAGKTTLLRCIAGLEAATSSRLTVAGETWEDSDSGISRTVQQRSVGYVFQEPRLFHHLDVRANIEYGVKRRSATGGAGFEHVVDLLGLDALLGRRPAELSGGEAQRVAIARALLCAPRFVLMDEPLASLDQRRRDEILPFLDRLHTEQAIPIIYVSHNIDEVCRLCDHLVVIEEGRVVAEGGLQDVLVRTDVAAIGGDHAGSVIEGAVVGYDGDDELTLLEFSGGTFRVPGRAGRAGDSVRLRIRAADVSLCRAKPADTTILNVLPAVIEAVGGGAGPSVLVRLVVGSDRIVARVTRRSVRELGLGAGDELFAQVKSVAVRSFREPGIATQA